MYHTTFELQQVQLNVMDLAGMSRFYQEVLGMAILNQTYQQVVLGTVADQRPLLTLQRVEQENEPSYGLYHVAYLVSSRQALGDFLRHIVHRQILIVGASDHGYSEAIYLEDPEGNGIEVYRDLPMNDWEVNQDGTIPGKTEEMDGRGVYESGQLTPDQTYQLPSDTRIGHVHLSVQNSQASAHWYQAVLGVQDKFSVPSGSWLSTGQYHHQIAVNQWAGSHLAKRQPGTAGLGQFSLQANDDAIYQMIKQQAVAHQAIVQLDEQQMELVDPNGIRLIVLAPVPQK